MSHLSILPTVLRDAKALAGCLEALGYHPIWGGALKGFANDCQSVVLQVELGKEARLGWSRQADGSLALVGDLQRLSRSQATTKLIGTITRRYATHMALREVTTQFSATTVTFSA